MYVYMHTYCIYMHSYMLDSLDDGHWCYWREYMPILPWLSACSGMCLYWRSRHAQECVCIGGLGMLRNVSVLEV